MTTITDIAGRQLQAAEPLVQLGLDLAAEHLAEYLGKLDPADSDDSYLDGLQDAITTLVEAGATDPRPCGCTRNPLGHTRAQHPSS